ncbi:hypothetical protein [Glycomyces sp. NPDC048151]|uniref:hypothetical protein n=1 Tax=Glycomyces sp. NPDC048151 TaxID=3364002 RepID=UPI0037236D2E
MTPLMVVFLFWLAVVVVVAGTVAVMAAVGAWSSPEPEVESLRFVPGHRAGRWSR